MRLICDSKNSSRAALAPGALLRAWRETLVRRVSLALLPEWVHPSSLGRSMMRSRRLYVVPIKEGAHVLVLTS